MRQSRILNRAPRFHGMESGVQHCLHRKEEEMGVRKTPGNDSGIAVLDCHTGDN